MSTRTKGSSHTKKSRAVADAIERLEHERSEITTALNTLYTLSERRRVSDVPIPVLRAKKVAPALVLLPKPLRVQAHNQQFEVAWSGAQERAGHAEGLSRYRTKLA